MNIEKSDLEIIKGIIEKYFNYFNGTVNMINKLERIIVDPFNNPYDFTIFARYSNYNVIIIYIKNILKYMEISEIDFSNDKFDTILIESIVHELFHADHYSNNYTDSKKEIFIEECEVHQKTLSFLKENKKAIYDDLDITINDAVLKYLSNDKYTQPQVYNRTSYNQLYFNTIYEVADGSGDEEFMKELNIALNYYDNIKLYISVNDNKAKFDIKSNGIFNNILSLNKYLQNSIYKYKVDLDYRVRSEVYEDKEDGTAIVDLKVVLFYYPIVKLTPVITKLKPVITKF